VAGLVTLEDAIEEIFGEVHDEFDLEEEPIVVADGRVSVRGDVLLSQLVDRFDLRIETDGVETVGGFAWHLLGRTPELGDAVALTVDGVELRVDAMERRSVTRASFPAPEAEPEREAEA
jgi:CBS domain containing-hemolysin-like protein